MASIQIVIDGEEHELLDERHEDMLDEILDSMGEEEVVTQYQRLLQKSIYQTRYGSQNR